MHMHMQGVHAISETCTAMALAFLNGCNGMHLCGSDRDMLVTMFPPYQLEEFLLPSLTAILQGSPVLFVFSSARSIAVLCHHDQKTPMDYR
jgi:hypothetical protein